jgi:hypothetical protein
MMTTDAQVVGQQKALLEVMKDKMDMIKAEHPNWHAEFEDVDPFIADRAEVERLLQDAPTEFASGLITGIMVIRQQVAIVTGREF